MYRCHSHAHLISCHVRCCGSHLKIPKFSKPVHIYIIISYNYMSKPYNNYNVYILYYSICKLCKCLWHRKIRSQIPISVYFYMISRFLPDCKSYTDIKIFYLFGSFTKIVYCCSKLFLYMQQDPPLGLLLSYIVYPIKKVLFGAVRTDQCTEQRGGRISGGVLQY